MTLLHILRGKKKKYSGRDYRRCLGKTINKEESLLEKMSIGLMLRIMLNSECLEKIQIKMKEPIRIYL